MEPTDKPGAREITRRDLPAVLGSLALIGLFITLTAFGHPWYGTATLAVGVAFAIHAMPHEQREAFGREFERHDHTPVGRVGKAFQLVVTLFLLYIIARALLVVSPAKLMPASELDSRLGISWRQNEASQIL